MTVAPTLSHSRPTPLPRAFREAIEEARDDVARLLDAADARGSAEAVAELVRRYNEREGARAADRAVPRVPLLVALAAVEQPTEHRLERLLIADHPLVRAALEQAGFDEHDVLTLGATDDTSDSAWIARHALSEPAFWERIRELLSTGGAVQAVLTSGELRILHHEGIMAAIGRLPEGGAVTVLGRLEEMNGAGPAEYDAVLAMVPPERSGGRPDAGRNGRGLRGRVDPLVRSGKLRLDVVPEPLDEPHFGILGDVVFVQQRHGTDESPAIVRVDHPSPELDEFVRRHARSLTRAAEPLLPALTVPGSTRTERGEHPNRPCGCGGTLVYARFPHLVHTKRGQPVRVEEVAGYRCTSCGLVLLEPIVADDLQAQVEEASSG